MWNAQVVYLVLAEFRKLHKWFFFFWAYTTILHCEKDLKIDKKKFYGIFHGNRKNNGDDAIMMVIEKFQKLTVVTIDCHQKKKTKKAIM